MKNISLFLFLISFSINVFALNGDIGIKLTILPDPCEVIKFEDKSSFSVNCGNIDKMVLVSVDDNPYEKLKKVPYIITISY